MKVKKTAHNERLVALRRIEGQIKGIQRMIEDGAYCIDIITQLHAAVNALYSVSDKIFAKHVEHCVWTAFEKGGKIEKRKKVEEIMRVIKKLHKFS